MACLLIILDLWARECATEDGGGGACASFGGKTPSTIPSERHRENHFIASLSRALIMQRASMKTAGVQYTQPILVKLKNDVQRSQVDVPSVDQLYTPKSRRTKAADRSSALRQISLPARGKQPAEVK